MEENWEALVGCKLDIPFKEFTAGQVIQSKQFNDDMKDVEDKTNQIIEKHNSIVESHNKHVTNFDNPHKTTAHQVGAYTIEEVDAYVDDLRNGNFNDGAIKNRVLGDSCVETRNIKDGNITIIKVDETFGSQLDISKNVDITNRYTKDETDGIIKSKVGDGTYTKEEIDDKLSQIQAGQIVDYTIGVNQLKTDVGELIDLSKNANIINRYTKDEVDRLISEGTMPRDWGSITDLEEYGNIGELPVADVMTCGEFRASISNILDVDIKEVVDARGNYSSLSQRLESIELNSGSVGDVDYETIVKLENLESTIDLVLNMFSSVIDIDVQQLMQTRGIISSISERIALSESLLNAIIIMFGEVIADE